MPLLASYDRSDADAVLVGGIDIVDLAIGRDVEVFPGETDAHRFVPLQVIEVEGALGLADQVEPLHPVFVGSGPVDPWS